MGRRTIRVEVTAEIVDRSVAEDGTIRVSLETPTGHGREPLRSVVHLYRHDVTEAEVVDFCRDAVLYDLREAAAAAERSRKPTIPALETLPRVPHEDRATILSKLVAERGEAMAKLHGPGWLRVLLAAELRAVYADGEAKGYDRRRADEELTAAGYPPGRG